MQTGEEYVPQFILRDGRRLKVEEEWDSGQAEVEEFATYYKRASAGVWTWLTVLTVALVAAVAYGYSVLQNENSRLTPIPSMSKTLPALNQHMVSFGKQLSAWRADQQTLSAQMNSIDSGWKAALGSTTQQTRDLLDHVQNTLGKDLSQRSALFQNELTELTNERNSDRARLAKVEGQLALARFDLESARQEYSQSLEAIREQQEVQNRQLVALTSSLETKRVAFEVEKNREVEVAPGVTLKLTRADVNRQMFNGWIGSVSVSGKLYVENQGVLKPVFIPAENDEAYKLVVTRITPKIAAGYLLVPVQSGRPAMVYPATSSKDESDVSKAILPVSDERVPDTLGSAFQLSNSDPGQ